MEIVRCKHSFRSGREGASEGDLFPAVHPLARKYKHLFEPVSDYVVRLHPTYAPAPEPAAKPAARSRRTSSK